MTASTSSMRCCIKCSMGNFTSHPLGMRLGELSTYVLEQAFGPWSLVRIPTWCLSRILCWSCRAADLFPSAEVFTSCPLDIIRIITKCRSGEWKRSKSDTAYFVSFSTSPHSQFSFRLANAFPAFLRIWNSWLTMSKLIGGTKTIHSTLYTADPSNWLSTTCPDLSIRLISMSVPVSTGVLDQHEGFRSFLSNITIVVSNPGDGLNTKAGVSSCTPPTAQPTVPPWSFSIK